MNDRLARSAVPEQLFRAESCTHPRAGWNGSSHGAPAACMDACSAHCYGLVCNHVESRRHHNGRGCRRPVRGTTLRVGCRVVAEVPKGWGSWRHEGSAVWRISSYEKEQGLKYERPMQCVHAMNLDVICAQNSAKGVASKAGNLALQADEAFLCTCTISIESLLN